MEIPYFGGVENKLTYGNTLSNLCADITEKSIPQREGSNLREAKMLKHI